tara:strand:- start:21 stop:440 length:420 start_codon:yes stop_codon:yes gene_type:complete
MSKLEVKPLCKENLKELLPIIQQLSSYNPGIISIEEDWSSFQKQNVYAIACFSDKKLVGAAFLFIKQKIRGGLVGNIEDVVVKKEYHNKGIGSLLIKQLISYANLRKCYSINLVCASENIGFYKKLGFSKAESEMKLRL